MQIEAEQAFTLSYPGTPAHALRFLRDPARALSGVRFLRDLTVHGDTVRAVLLVNVPLLGEINLPMHSLLVPTDQGARLEAQPLEGERAWIELSGNSAAQGTQLSYSFQFRAHIEVPSAEKWGGAAFEKMVRAAAERTLSKLTRELPEGIARAMTEEL